MRHFTQFNLNIKKEDILQENTYIEDNIVIKDEFSSSEDDRQFYQQLVSQLSNDAEESETIIIADDEDEYDESEGDSVDREFFQELRKESLSNNEESSESSITRGLNSVNNDSAEEEIDVGSAEDLDFSERAVSSSPLIPEGIKTRLRVKRPKKQIPSNDTKDKSRQPTKKKKKRILDHRALLKQQVQFSLLYEERAVHNGKERERRGNLRVSFTELRDLVPAIAGKSRTSKITILHEAAEYCQQLRKDFLERHRIVIELCQEQKRLRSRVDKLRKAVM